MYHMAISRAKVSARSRGKSAEESFENASSHAKGRWERFKENTLVQGFSSGASRFGRFMGSKLQHAGQDFVAGYRGFRENRKDRHVVEDFANNLDYLQTSGVQFERQQDGSYRMVGVSDKGRSLISRFEAFYGAGTQVDMPQDMVPENGNAQSHPNTGKPGKETKDAPAPEGDGRKDVKPENQTSSDDRKDAGKGTAESEKPSPQDVTPEKEGDGGVLKDAASKLQENADKGMDDAILAMMEGCKAYLSMSKEDKAKNFGELANMVSGFGTMLNQKREAMLKEELGDVLPEEQQEPEAAGLDVGV